MKTRHYFIKNDKADELSDVDLVFVYQCCSLDEKGYLSYVLDETSLHQSPLKRHFHAFGGR